MNKPRPKEALLLWKNAPRIGAFFIYYTAEDILNLQVETPVCINACMRCLDVHMPQVVMSAGK